MSAEGLDVEWARDALVLSVRVSCSACGRRGDATAWTQRATPTNPEIAEAAQRAEKAIAHKPGCPVAVMNNRPTAAGE
jgi:hypothetical protein